MKINEIQRESIAPEKLEEPAHLKENTGKKSWWWIVQLIVIGLAVCGLIIGPIISIVASH